MGQWRSLPRNVWNDGSFVDAGLPVIAVHMPLKEGSTMNDPALSGPTVGLDVERTDKTTATNTLPDSGASREQRCIAELMGTLDWDDTFDHKAERSRRTDRRDPAC